MPLLGVSVTLGGGLDGGLSAGTVPSSPPASTPPASTPSTPSTPATPATPAPVAPARDLKMTAGETLYLNTRQGVVPTAWVAYSVAYVFGDGNAVLIREPDCVVYTAELAVGFNLRRKGQSYGDSTPGP